MNRNKLSVELATYCREVLVPDIADGGRRPNPLLATVSRTLDVERYFLESGNLLLR
jgi:hypothetical protein